MNHQLKIESLHDAQASCACGKWSYSKTGEVSRWEIEREHRQHVTAVAAKELHELAKAVAFHLGYHYELGKPSDWPGNLDHEGNLRHHARIVRVQNGEIQGALYVEHIEANRRDRQGRYSINVAWPTGRSSGVKTVSAYRLNGRKSSITVSTEKSPAQIAKDIKNRLLSDAESLYQEAAGYIKSENDYEDGKYRAAAKVAQLLGKPFKRPEHYDSRDISFHVGEGYNKHIEVSSATSIKVKIDTDEHGIEKIVEFLKTLEAA